MEATTPAPMATATSKKAIRFITVPPSNTRTRSRHLGDRFSLNGGHHVDVAMRGFRIWALEMGAVCNFLGNCRLDTGQQDVQAGLQKVATASRAQVNFGIDGEIGLQSDFHPGCHNFDRREEAR